MTIKQQGGIFGRNPTFNDINVDNDISISGDATVTGKLGVGGTNAILGFYAEKDNGSGYVGGFRSTNSSPYLTVQTTGGVTNLQGINSGFTDVAAIGLQPSGGNINVGAGNFVMTSGYGIDFSATSGTGTSELFDDYEEGTWTPVYTPETGSFGSLTMDVITATYTKIGRTVVANCAIRTDDVDTTGVTGNLLTITGLPFASASSHNVACSISNASQWAGDTPLSAIVSSSSTTVFLMYRTSVNGADNYLLCGDMTSGTNADKNRLILTAVYEAA